MACRSREDAPVVYGLLGGVFWKWLLDKENVKEVVINKEDVRNADRIFLINSVRKWIKAVLL